MRVGKQSNSSTGAEASFSGPKLPLATSQMELESESQGHKRMKLSNGPPIVLRELPHEERNLRNKDGNKSGRVTLHPSVLYKNMSRPAQHLLCRSIYFFMKQWLIRQIQNFCSN